jgi:hypothetical protein
MIKLKDLLNEGKYQIYHSTYSSAISTALDYIKDQGYEVEDDTVFNRISAGPKKPSEGRTNRIDLNLLKNGKSARKAAHIQIFNTGTKYELNIYIN